MDAYDGAEVCELVVIFIFYQISLNYDRSNVGINRDDSLAVFKNVSGPQVKKLRNVLKTYSIKII